MASRLTLNLLKTFNSLGECPSTFSQVELPDFMLSTGVLELDDVVPDSRVDSAPGKGMSRKTVLSRQMGISGGSILRASTESRENLLRSRTG